MTLFSNPGVAVAALLSVRLGALLLTAPAFSARAVPMQVRTALLALLTLLLWPTAAATGGAVQVTAPALLAEATIGLVLGLGAAVMVAAAEAAGDALAVQMGLSGANVVNPLTDTQMPVLGQMLGLTTITLLLASGGHLVLLEALAASLRTMPVGGPIVADGAAASVAGLGGTVFLLGLRFAAPVTAAMMVGNAALGVLARTVPQLNVLMVAFPLQIAVGLFALAVSLPLIATVLTGWDVLYVDLVSGLLQALALGGAR